MNAINQNNNDYYRKTSLSLIFCALWCIVPPMLVNPFCRIMAVVCMCIFMLRGGLFKSNFTLKLFVWGIYIIGMGFLANGFSFIVQYLQVIIVFAFIYIANERSEEYSYSNQTRVIFYIIMLAYPVFMILTMRALVENPHLARQLVNNQNVDVVSYCYQGIGGYGMIYSLVFHNIICLHLLLRKAKNKFLIIINYALSFATVVLAGYSIALVSLIVGSFVVLLNGKNDDIDSKKIIATIFLAIVVAIFLWLFKEQIIGLVSRVVEGSLYEHKWADIVNSLNGDTLSGTVADREVLYRYSLQQFLSHPIFGMCATGKLKSGGHSFILDTFADFGVIGGIPLIYFIFGYFIDRIKKRCCVGLSIAMCVTLLLVSLFNNWAAALAPIVYLLYPAIAQGDNKNIMGGY